MNGVALLRVARGLYCDSSRLRTELRLTFVAVAFAVSLLGFSAQMITMTISPSSEPDFLPLWGR